MINNDSTSNEQILVKILVVAAVGLMVVLAFYDLEGIWRGILDASS